MITFPKKNLCYIQTIILCMLLSKNIYFSSKVGRKTILTLTCFKTIWGASVYAYSERVHFRMDTDIILEVQHNVMLL